MRVFSNLYLDRAYLYRFIETMPKRGGNCFLHTVQVKPIHVFCCLEV